VRSRHNPGSGDGRLGSSVHCGTGPCRMVGGGGSRAGILVRGWL
jgi:hypothetical protein